LRVARSRTANAVDGFFAGPERGAIIDRSGPVHSIVSAGLSPQPANVDLA
jgi:hypothetical protein